MKNFSKLLMAVGLAMGFGLSGVANASSTTQTITWLGSYPEWTAGSGSAVVNTFTDFFNFSFPTAAIPAVEGVSTTVTARTNVIFSSLNVYDVNSGQTVGTGTTCASVGRNDCSWVVNFFVPVLSTSPQSLLGDAYQFIAHGIGTGTGGRGGYSINATIDAVPEPETYAMLLAGLGLLLFTVRSRKNNGLGGDFA